MLPGKIFSALFITSAVSGCTLFKKPVAPDYSTSLYINSNTGKKDSVHSNPATGTSQPALSRSDSLLKSKYAQHLQVPADSITNLKLYRFIDEWLNTPYLWGGTSKRH